VGEIKKNITQARKVGIIVQARMGSTRYPGKVLKEIYKDATLLDIIVDNLKKLDHTIIIATTKKKIDKCIVNLAINHNIDYYCGDENNVLKRFINCSLKFDITNIIRICADNVFIQNQFISQFIDNLTLNYDYMSYKVGNINSILTHWGLFGEYITLSALETVQKKTNNKEYLEHVTNYIYLHPNEFKIKYWDAPKELIRSDVRLTIDNQEDFEICKKIIEYLQKHNLDWSYKNIINYLDMNQNLIEKMRKIILANKKF